VDVVVSWLPRSRYLSALESDNTSQCQHPYPTHGTGIFTYMNGLKFMVNVGKYSSPMDPLGYGNEQTSFCFVFSDVSLETSLLYIYILTIETSMINGLTLQTVVSFLCLHVGVS